MSDSENDASFRHRDAYHEAGHAAMTWFFGQGNDIFYIELKGGDFGGAYMRVVDIKAPQLISRSLKEGDHLYATALASVHIMYNLAGSAVDNKMKDNPDSVATWLDSLFKATSDFDDERPISDLGQAVQIARAIVPG